VRSGTAWSQQQKLTASDGAASDYFGRSVSVSGDTAMVGANGDDIAYATDAGSAYVFVRSGTAWSQQQKLTAADGAMNDQFGACISVSGETAVVGAFSHDTAGGANAGSAYVFVRSGMGWYLQQQLTASDGAMNDSFGLSVSVSADTAVVAATGDNSLAGSAYVFVRTGTLWSEEQKLTASDGAANDHFGISVSVSGGTVVVGAYGDNSLAGSAYVFTDLIFKDGFQSVAGSCPETNDLGEIFERDRDGDGVGDACDVVAVRIDVEPGRFPNRVNPRQGSMAVAILTTSTFDALTVDPESVRFGPNATEAGAWQWAPEDVDGDGDVDLVLHFQTGATGIRCGATEVKLKGSALAGPIEGRDSIRTVGRACVAIEE
jgi:hypothetical protein